MTTSSNLPEINTAELSPSDGIDDGTASYLDAADDDLEKELMSDFSKLQINSSDCPRTFSPIGSERTSPEQGLQCDKLAKGFLMYSEQLVKIFQNNGSKITKFLITYRYAFDLWEDTESCMYKSLKDFTKTAFS